jgi:hypothetical protein
MKGRTTLAALVVAVVLAACTAADQTVSPPPSATPSVPATPPASADPSAPPAVGWEPATVPDSENVSATLSIVPGGDGLVAIGFDGAFGSLLWTSADGGRTWTDITPADFASIGIASVVEHDGRLVGVGRGNTIDIETEEAAVYLSDDGRAWRKVGAGGQMLGQLIDVVATDDGLFAVGGVPGADSAGVWRSADGESWERVGPDIEHAFLWSIAEGGPGLVAVGWRRNPDPDLAVWTSADLGETWELAPDPEGFAGHEATDIATIGDTLVMVGSAFDGSGGRAWTSTDGIAWTQADADFGAAYARSLAVTPAGLIAVGGGPDMNGRAWISSDGGAWEPLGDPLAGAFFNSAVALDDGLLLTGATQSGTLETGVEAHAAVWLATLD